MSSGNPLSQFPALRTYIDSLCSIPAGTFQMGSKTGDIDERPVHTVKLSKFRMGATPVTVAVWKEYCADTKTPLPDAPPWGLLDDHPIVNVSWNDIMGLDGKGGFCAWASDVASFRLTLPTESQFEYASRGGEDGLAFPWGDVFDAAKVWCGGSETTELRTTVSVFRIRDLYINSFGLIDMSGNVFQWCSDWYGRYLKSSKKDSDATRSSRLYRCVRGGSWDADYPEGFRCANRYGFSPNDWGIYIGFRLVAGPPSADSG